MHFIVSKSEVKIFMLLLLFSILISACTSINETNENKESIQVENNLTKEKKPIYFRITWTEYSGRGTAINEIVNVFNKTNDSNYEIVMVGGDEDTDHITATLKDIENPMIYALPYRLVKYYGEHGDLLDLSGNFASESELFYPEIVKLGRVNDSLYGIPWVGHSICLIYNLDLLDSAGVNPSEIKSLESFVSALDKIQTQTGISGVGLVGADHNDVSWMVNQFVYAFGGALVDNDGQKVLINNQLAKEAILFYKDTLGLYAQPTWKNDTGTEVMNYFREGKIAFEFQGIWGVTDIDKNKNPFKIGVLPLNAIDLRSEVGPIMLSTSKKMPDEMKIICDDFIKFMISSEAQEMIFKGEYSPEYDAYFPFRVPMRTDIAESMTSTDYSKYLPFLSGFDNPSIDVPTSRWQIIKEQLYQPGLHKVFNSELSVTDFLTDIETEGNIILNKHIEVEDK